MEEDSGLQLNRESVEPKSHGAGRGSIKNIVVIFSKVPVAGAVKTRLIQDSSLDAEDAALLAEAMLKDTIVLSAESNASEIVIGFTPADERESMERIVKEVVKERHLERPIVLLTQSGTNFDERFGSAVSAAFAMGSENLVILGEDLPYLPPDIINRAFSFLTEDGSNNSVVLGPAAEGGIYLVGVTRRFNPEYFSKNQLFSRGVELSQFIKLCKNEGKALKLLPAFTDVDIEGDLVSLLLYIDAMKVAKKFDGFHYPRYTADAITQLRLIVLERRGETRHRRIGIM
ncbi:MAG: TIGR04282 family arsenosugar biosynthesis glycosyltransferase [Halobacteriota archaeon]